MAGPTGPFATALQLHTNTQVPPRISAQELVHPNCRDPAAAGPTDQMPAGYTFSPRRRHVSFKRVDVVFKKTVLLSWFFLLENLQIT